MGTSVSHILSRKLCVEGHCVFITLLSLVLQEIMVGCNYQAEIPALACYNDEEKGECQQM